MSQLPAPSLIAELELRHDEAMQSLSELERRIEEALAQFGGTLPSSGKGVKAGMKGNPPLSLSGSPAEGLKLHSPEDESSEVEKPAAA